MIIFKVVWNAFSSVRPSDLSGILVNFYGGLQGLLESIGKIIVNMYVRISLDSRNSIILNANVVILNANVVIKIKVKYVFGPLIFSEN